MKALRRFLGEVLHQRDIIERALHKDRRSEKTQQRLLDWRSTGGFAPSGRTTRLLARWSGRTGPGRLRPAYEAATIEAWRQGQGFLIRELRSLLDVHGTLLAEAQRKFEESAELCDSCDDHDQASLLLMDIVQAAQGLWIDGCTVHRLERSVDLAPNEIKLVTALYRAPGGVRRDILAELFPAASKNYVDQVKGTANEKLATIGLLIRNDRRGTWTLESE